MTKLDPAARRFLAMVGLAGSAAHAGIEERRASFSKLMRFSVPPALPVDVAPVMIPGCGGHAIKARLYAASSAPSPSPGLIFFHGGGLVAGSLDTHDALCRTLAVDSRCRIVSIGYRLAPEHPFPAAILDAYAAVRFCRREARALGIDPTRIGVGGDSAGGSLAAIVARVLGRQIGLRVQVLLCPVLDVAGAYRSRDDFGAGYLLDGTTMVNDLAHYAPRRPIEHPRISPLRAGPGTMPSTLLYTAGYDPLRDEGFAYAARLREAGIVVRHVDHASLIHHFYALTGVIPAAGPAVAAIAADIGAALGASADRHGPGGD